MPRPSLFLLSALALTLTSTAGCGPDVTGVFDETTSSGSAGDGGGGTGGDAGTGGVTTAPTTGGGGTTTTTPTSTTSAPCGPGGANEDQDGDGFTPATGDCDDCDPEVNPNAIDFPGGVDEDCNGVTNDVLTPCDEAVAMDTQDPKAILKAVELCKISKGENDWGVSDAVWSLPDGAPIPAGEEQDFHRGHGVLADFGPGTPPRAGKSLLALSSGAARDAQDPGYQSPQGFNKGYTSNPAPGFPKETPECNVQTGTPNDAIALNIALRVPSNAHAISYDYTFYAFDFPGFVCSNFNDTHFALFEPKLPGMPDLNVAYDELGHPITLNGANFHVCTCQNGPPCSAGNKMYPCDQGTAALMGTGFEGHGATGWLTTTIPVEPGTNISLRWGIYDAGDGTFESTVLIDNFQWKKDPVEALSNAQAE
ncbi:MAG: choice-of-anchor L domain-containing protein [Polyangiaceae bacterium]